MRRIIFLLTALICMSACTIVNQMEGQLLESSEISLTWKNSVQISYDSDGYQLGYVDKDNIYRVYNDEVTTWFTVKCSEKPVSEGQTLTADVSWKKGTDSIKTFSRLEMIVKKADDTGLVWLWNTKNSIGILLKNL